MDQAQWWIIDILLPVVLLIALVWLVFLRRSNRTSDRTEEGHVRYTPTRKGVGARGPTTSERA